METKSLRSLATLNDDFDYVRSLAYSSYSQTLFSAADNGIVRQWDLGAEKTVGKQVSD